MCGRYALNLSPTQIRQMLQDDQMPVWGTSPDDDDGDHAPRQSYNFAPGYHGVVYRADTPDTGAGPLRGHNDSTETDSGGNSTSSPAKKNKSPAKPTRVSQSDIAETTTTPATTTTTTGTATKDSAEEIHYKLQSMKWGLIPFWTKRNPGYGNMLKTINCRDDSLAQPGGLWNTMKARKRCIVVAQGFYEWLKNGKEKTPHYIKRKDGHLMLFAGLWDCVQYEEGGGDKGGGEKGGEVVNGEKHYTYTVITTDSNKQLKFLHDRMPVIFDAASPEMKTWLDPGRHEWSKELQGLLKPFEGELECYAVSKEVGKVGNNSPSFIIPVASKENKANIANFFANAGGKGTTSPLKKSVVKKEEMSIEDDEVVRTGEELVKKNDNDLKDEGIELNIKEEEEIKKQSSSVKVEKLPSGKKRIATDDFEIEEPSPKKKETSSKTISATRNPARSPTKGKKDATPKITRFFGNSA